MCAQLIGKTMLDSFDFEIIPGSNGIQFEDGRNITGLDLLYTDEDDTPIDLSGSTLHFTASTHYNTPLTIETPDITWDSATGRIIVPMSASFTRELGKQSFIKYSLEARTGLVQDVFLDGKISIRRTENAD